MILKNYEIEKINLEFTKFILCYGQNEGYKNQSIKILTKNYNEISVYDEKEVLDNTENFLESLSTKSLFQEKKIIIIKRASDKILKFIDGLKDKDLSDLNIIINSGILEKKSKLRVLFEKDKNFACIAFYPDNEQTLFKLANNFLKEKKLSISSSNINIIISRCNSDRENMLNELQKIEFFSKNNKKITSEAISKLTNLSENYDISELVNNSLAKNKNKIIKILNENNFNNDDCILIIRMFLNKSKKILALSTEFEKNKDLDLTISLAKPPIFWKEKEITKQQICGWKPQNIRKLIYKLNKLELLVKKNFENSVNLIVDFIFEQIHSQTNN